MCANQYFSVHFEKSTRKLIYKIQSIDVKCDMYPFDIGVEKGIET
jgi:hypothetical protein